MYCLITVPIVLLGSRELRVSHRKSWQNAERNRDSGGTGQLVTVCNSLRTKDTIRTEGFNTLRTFVLGDKIRLPEVFISGY